LVFTALQSCHSCSWFGPDLIKEVVRWDDRNKVIPKEGIEAFIASKAPLTLRLKDSKSLCLSKFVEINSRWQRTWNLQVLFTSRKDVRREYQETGEKAAIANGRVRAYRR